MNTFVIDPALREAVKQRSNLRGSLAVLRDWGLFLLAFSISLFWPHPVSYLLSVLLLSGVQVGLAILMHEAAHRALFANARVNDWLGQYLCALPIFNSMPMYRSYHMAHHRLAGTRADPDFVMVEHYPVRKGSLRRKLLRDLIGITGFKALIGLNVMIAGYWKYQQNGVVERVEYPSPQGLLGHLAIYRRNGGLIAIGWQLAIFGALLSLHHGSLYLLWALAYLIPFPLMMRIRVLADHAVVENPLSTNPIEHARSTRANWLEKLLVAPHNEHYHLEHHLMPSAPFWNLPKLHAALIEQNAIPAANTANGMLDVLRRATR